MDDLTLLNRRKLFEVLKFARVAQPDVGLTALSAFLAISNEPGRGIIALAKSCGLRTGTASRTARSLISEEFTGSLPPHRDLVSMFYDPDDNRCRILELTPAGIIFRDQIDKLIGGSIK